MIDWKSFEGRKVLVNIETVKGMRMYSGLVNEVTYIGKSIHDIDLFFIEITDKFGERVGFTSSSIKLIEEER
jgi:hypothetical protein